MFWIFDIVKAAFREPLGMAGREPQRRLRRGKNNEQRVHWEQAAKDEVLWIEKKGRPGVRPEEQNLRGKSKGEPEDWCCSEATRTAKGTDRFIPVMRRT